MIRHRRSVKHSSPLLRHASNVTSQGGEDGIIRHIMQCVSSSKHHRLLSPPSEAPWLVEIGSWDGKHLSNSFSLLHDHLVPWHGLLVEASPVRTQAAQDLYADNARVACVCALAAPGSFAALLREHGVPDDLDLLSIDIDGGDFHLLAALRPTTIRPRLVVVEFNPSVPNCVTYIQADAPGVHKGSSLRALTVLGAEIGYQLVTCTSFNAFLLRADLLPLVPDCPHADLDLDALLFALHPEDMTTSMLQTYDGELKYAGVLKLLWADPPVAINAQQLQALKAKDRKFVYAPEHQEEE